MGIYLHHSISSLIIFFSSSPRFQRYDQRWDDQRYEVAINDDQLEMMIRAGNDVISQDFWCFYIFFQGISHHFQPTPPSPRWPRAARPSPRPRSPTRCGCWRSSRSRTPSRSPPHRRRAFVVILEGLLKRLKGDGKMGGFFENMVFERRLQGVFDGFKGYTKIVRVFIVDVVAEYYKIAMILTLDTSSSSYTSTL